MITLFVVGDGVVVYQSASFGFNFLVVHTLSHKDGCGEHDGCLAVGINCLIVEVITPEATALRAAYYSYYRFFGSLSYR